MTASGEPRPVLLEGRELTKVFPGSRRGVPPVRAVDGVTISLRQGETLGLVGESGCGKSTLSRCLVRLDRPSSGSVFFDGTDITELAAARLRGLRRQFQVVFQDPSGSLDPRMTVGQLLTEGLRAHRIGSRESRRGLVANMLSEVGLDEDMLDRYPASFSGGQQQRIGIARALLLNPRLLVADEPVSALDVSVQAQILNLLVRLRHDFGLTMLFVAHDLAVVAYVSDRIAVMYLGRIVEIGGAEDLVRAPQHPYTAGLLAAVPRPGHREDDLLIQGDVPSPQNPPTGCRFHPRCPIRRDICRHTEPPLLDAGGGRTVACHFPGQHPIRTDLLQTEDEESISGAQE